MIYFLANTLAGRDGGSRAGADFLSHMLAPGLETTVVCRDRCPLPDKVDGQPVPATRWLRLPEIEGAPRSLLADPRSLVRSAILAPRAWADTMSIRRGLRQRPPTIAAHNGFPAADTLNDSILAAAPYRLIFVHSSPDALDFFSRNNARLSREWVSRRLRQADKLVFLAPRVRDEWSETADLDVNRTTIIPNTTREDEALEVRRMSRIQLRRRLSLPEDAFVACCVGKVDIAKGQDLMVKALACVAQTIPSLSAVFVGPVTASGEQIRSASEAAGLGQQVAFVGSQADPYSFIRAADLLVHPSRAEGQPLVLLEAMVLGTPILATDVGGVSYTIEHGSSGWLVKPNDEVALGEALLQLASDPGLRDRLSVAAESRYWSCFSRAQHRAGVRALMQESLVAAAAKITHPGGGAR